MADTPQATIKAAATAYVTGDPNEQLQNELHEYVRVHGSHQNDDWNGRSEALNGLTNELRRHRNAGRPDTDGEFARGSLLPGLENGGELQLHRFEEFNGADPRGLAWWTTRGSLMIDGTNIPDASWTVVVKEFGPDDWQIVHSHFSIHHVPDGGHPPDDNDEPPAAKTGTS